MSDDNDIVRGIAEAPSMQHLENWLGCPNRVKLGSRGMSALSLLHPNKQTLVRPVGRSVRCQKRKFGRVAVTPARQAAKGRDATPVSGPLQGDRTQEVTLADVDPAMAQDRVGDRDMEIEVR